jgi:hypothetical protein
MLLVLQFVSKTFYRHTTKEGCISSKAIRAHQMRNSSSRRRAATEMMRNAAQQFGSISLLRWLEKLGYASYATDYCSGAIRGAFFFKCILFLSQFFFS